MLQIGSHKRQYAVVVTVVVLWSRSYFQNCLFAGAALAMAACAWFPSIMSSAGVIVSEVFGGNPNTEFKRCSLRPLVCLADCRRLFHSPHIWANRSLLHRFIFLMSLGEVVRKRVVQEAVSFISSQLGLCKLL